MSSFHFAVTVKEPGKEPRTVPAQIGGGHPVSAEWLAKHYEDTNAFPGAESIEIQEVESGARVLPLNKAVALKHKVTPRAKIGTPIKKDLVREVTDGPVQPSSQPASSASNKG